MLELGSYEHALMKTVIEAMEVAPDFAQGGPGVIVMIAPNGYALDDYEDILAKLAVQGAEDSSESALVFVRAGDKLSKIKSSFDRDVQNHQRLIVLVEDGVDLPAVIAVAADTIIHLPQIGAGDLQASCSETLAIDMTLRQARKALSYPQDALWAALRPGRPMKDVLRRLALHSKPRSLRSDRPAVAPLGEMHGYGDAKAWGLQLARDLEAWRSGEIGWDEVDRGIVLSGPPGVGKTIFAKALAQECGAHLIATSMAQWQAAGSGHLGDLLQAMRSSFVEARKNAPTILFIDELDSVGDRNSFAHENRGYSTQVVNALLEALDGLDDREGVVVVGATNEISRIDPALLRAGRLDKHVAISKPTPNERVAIIERMTGLTLKQPAFDKLLIATHDMTGADLAKAVRDGRRSARSQQRVVAADDILSALPPLISPPADFLHLAAVHETGHTLVGVALGIGEHQGTFVVDRIRSGTDNLAGGLVKFLLPPFLIEDREVILNRIAMTVAGMAAEQVWLGRFCNGSGGSSTSDLAQATRLATLIETALGMGSTLRYSAAQSDQELEALRQNDPALCRRIEETLKQQFERAEAIIKAEKNFGNLLIDELVRHKRVTPDRFLALKQASQRDNRPRTGASAKPNLAAGMGA